MRCVDLWTGLGSGLLHVMDSAFRRRGGGCIFMFVCTDYGVYDWACR